MKKTKIVCTMGPNSEDVNVMRSLIKEGMDIARFNFLMELMRSRKNVWTCSNASVQKKANRLLFF